MTIDILAAALPYFLTALTIAAIGDALLLVLAAVFIGVTRRIAGKR